MKESEARKKWCPLVRIGFTAPLGSAAAVNRLLKYPSDDSVKEETCCLGSGCMMWRMDNGPGGQPGTPDSRGHCGLAGDAP